MVLDIRNLDCFSRHKWNNAIFILKMLCCGSVHWQLRQLFSFSFCVFLQNRPALKHSECPVQMHYLPAALKANDSSNFILIMLHTCISLARKWRLIELFCRFLIFFYFKEEGKHYDTFFCFIGSSPAFFILTLSSCEQYFITGTYKMDHFLYLGKSRLCGAWLVSIVIANGCLLKQLCVSMQHVKVQHIMLAYRGH